jgi:hypothetical protein
MCVPSSKVETETTTTTVPDGNTTTTSTTIPGTIITGLDLGYNHVMAGLSRVCGRCTTTPPQPGAEGQATLTRPDNSMSTTTFMLNDMGASPFQFDINQFGTYTVDVIVQTSGGPSGANGMIDVGPTQSSGP